jgi:hypothetical protein
METIRILFYTDKYTPMDTSTDFVLEPANPFQSSFGLSMLRDLLLKNQPIPKILLTSTNIEITLVNRNIPFHGARKFTNELLSCFDEVWVFGFYQANMPEYTPEAGGPENKLDRQEIAALKKWMDMGGGVLVMGDHANPDPRISDSSNGHETYLSLGRALGKYIPRAGQMRKWEGPPTTGTTIPTGALRRDNFNTQEFGAEVDIENLKLQSDQKPQRIFLGMFEALDINYLFPKKVVIRPHDLFYIGNGRSVDVFPDHMHEGELLTPDTSTSDWPPGCPKTSFVAWGVDKRFSIPDLHPLVSVFDGDDFDVGRIVADTSFHHYTNINLRCLLRDPEGTCEPSADLDLIGNYYINLALWLAPKLKRRAIGVSLLIRLVAHPQILEEEGNSCSVIGRTAKSILEQESRPIEINEIIRLLVPNQVSSQTAKPLSIPVELVLGAVIQKFNKLGGVSKLAEESEIREKVINDGFKHALELYLGELESQVSNAHDLLKTLL